MDILDDMGASKLSAKVFFFKVNYSFNFNIYKDHKNPANISRTNNEQLYFY